MKIKSFAVSAALVLANTFAHAAPAPILNQGVSVGSIDYGNAPYVKVYGTSSSDKYVIYQLKPTEDPDVFNSNDEWALSTETLPHFMLFVAETDVNRNGYSCRIICTNRFGEVVGLNPHHYRKLGILK